MEENSKKYRWMEAQNQSAISWFMPAEVEEGDYEEQRLGVARDLQTLVQTPGWKILQESRSNKLKYYRARLQREKEYDAILDLQAKIEALEWDNIYIDSVLMELQHEKAIQAPDV